MASIDELKKTLETATDVDQRNALKAMIQLMERNESEIQRRCPVVEAAVRAMVGVLEVVQHSDCIELRITENFLLFHGAYDVFLRKGDKLHLTLSAQHIFKGQLGGLDLTCNLSDPGSIGKCRDQIWKMFHG